mgnify:CR=1 FL=1
MAKFKDFAGWYNQVYSGLSMEQRQAVLDYINSSQGLSYGFDQAGRQKHDEIEAKALSALAGAGYDQKNAQTILNVGVGNRYFANQETWDPTALGAAGLDTEIGRAHV